MFGIGETEIVLIAIFAFMIFGPDKLPSIGRTIGKMLKQFKDAQEGLTRVVQTEIVDPAAEAMGTAPKKPNRVRADEYDEDADLEPEDETSPRPRRTETFAERKARLAKEKKEAAASAAAALEAVSAADESGDADTSAVGAPGAEDEDVDAAGGAAAESGTGTAGVPAVEPTSEPAGKKSAAGVNPASAAAAPRSAADLYALKRPAKRDAPTNAETQQTTDVPAPGLQAEDVPETPADSVATKTSADPAADSGEEDGNA